MKISVIRSLLITLSALVLAGISLASSARAQSPLAPESAAVTGSTWHKTVGKQHATLLRSRNETVRALAMQNLIILSNQQLSNQQPGTLDLRPTIPHLLDIYAYDASRAHRIMAVATLSAIGDRYSMEELDRLSAKEHRASQEYRVAQDALAHYYITQLVERETKRAAYYTAKGDAEKAERHTQRAIFYRSKLG